MTKTSPTNDLAAAAEPQSAWQQLGEVLLIVLVFFIVAGDRPPHVNEAHYLSRLKHYWNPEWCAGDFFLESQDTQLVLIWTFGWTTRWLSLPAAAWVGRLLAWTLLAWAWQRLSWRLVPRPLAAVLAAALFVALNEFAHLAGEWIVGGVEGKGFAYAFVLIALRALVDRHWNRLWLALGVATAWHPLAGGWSVIVCAAIWLIDDRLAAPLRSMVAGLLGGAALGLFGIVPALMLTWNEPPELVAEANYIYVFDRLPHHLAPLTLATEEVVRRIGGHAALLAALAVLTRLLHAMFPDRAACLRRIVLFAWGAAILAAIGFAIELALWNQPLIASRLLRYYWFRLTDFAAPMATALCATSLVAAGIDGRRRWAAGALAAALALAGWPLAHTAMERYEKRVPPADAKLNDVAGWAEACDWIAANTPPDALFLTPRLNLTFRWRAGRPEVVNRKDVPQNARSILEWHRRISEIYSTKIGGVESTLDSLGVLGAERVRRLALKYGADYVLMDRGQLLSLPVVFRNQEYVVYRIDRDDGTVNE